MNEHAYKHAFLVAVAMCLVLVGTLVYVIRGNHWSDTTCEEPSIVAAKGPDAAASPLPVTPPSPATSPLSLSPVQLSPQRLQAIGVTTALVELREVSKELRAPGNVDINERQLSYVQTRFPGWIQKVFANATYQYVRKGQPLFTIYSQDLVSTEQEYLLAKQSQQAFSTDGHGTAAKESGWLLQSAADRLRQFGVPPTEVTRLERTGAVQHDVAVESPASGYITEFNALPNLYAQADTKLYTIADLSSVWVYANVFQGDVGQLKPGNPATVTVDAYPGRNFHGRIDQILPQVDPMTRTVRVRFVFSNPGIALKPGMFVNVSLSIPLGRQLLIPAAGALQAGTREIAFIDRGGGSFEPREIEVGPRLDDHIVVLKGLHAGERIVSSANFLVDSESQLQAAMGSFAPSPAEAGQAAANTPEQVFFDFRSEPSPLSKGNNTLRVKVKSAEGKTAGPAQISIRFYSAAMPAMGMAAVERVATLADRGDGLYEGSVQLPNAGTYQVTITMLRSGQMVATKQFSAIVTGGM